MPPLHTTWFNGNLASFSAEYVSGLCNTWRHETGNNMVMNYRMNMKKRCKGQRTRKNGVPVQCGCICHKEARKIVFEGDPPSMPTPRPFKAKRKYTRKPKPLEVT